MTISEAIVAACESLPDDQREVMEESLLGQLRELQRLATVGKAAAECESSQRLKDSKRWPKEDLITLGSAVVSAQLLAQRLTPAELEHSLNPSSKQTLPKIRPVPVQWESLPTGGSLTSLLTGEIEKMKEKMAEDLSIPPEIFQVVNPSPSPESSETPETSLSQNPPS